MVTNHNLHEVEASLRVTTSTRWRHGTELLFGVSITRNNGLVDDEDAAGRNQRHIEV